MRYLCKCEFILINLFAFREFWEVGCYTNSLLFVNHHKGDFSFISFFTIEDKNKVRRLSSIAKVYFCYMLQKLWGFSEVYILKIKSIKNCWRVSKSCHIFHLTLQRLVFTKRSCVLKQTCSWKLQSFFEVCMTFNWKPGIKKLRLIFQLSVCT